MSKTVGLIAIMILASGPQCIYSQAGDPAALQQKLNAQFKLTTIAADRSDIVTAGYVVAIHKPGMVMYAVASPLPPSNTYKNGKIGQGWGGFGKDFGITMLAPGGSTAANYPHRTFVPEEKCWVTGVVVQKDGVLFRLYSDPYDNIRYYGDLKIPFPNKKEVPPVDTALQLIGDVLTVAPPENQPEAPPQTAQAPPPAAPAPPPAPPTQYQDVAPPPPPPPPAPTVAIGERKEQVLTDFGEPQRKALSGPKEIYFYSDLKMKVTFTNGKVSNIE